MAKSLPTHGICIPNYELPNRMAGQINATIHVRLRERERYIRIRVFNARDLVETDEKKTKATENYHFVLVRRVHVISQSKCEHQWTKDSQDKILSPCNWSPLFSCKSVGFCISFSFWFSVRESTCGMQQRTTPRNYFVFASGITNAQTHHSTYTNPRESDEADKHTKMWIRINRNRWICQYFAYTARDCVENCLQQHTQPNKFWINNRVRSNKFCRNILFCFSVWPFFPPFKLFLIVNILCLRHVFSFYFRICGRKFSVTSSGLFW